MKRVEVLCDPEMQFSMGEEVVAAANLTVEQAETIAGQYPDQYVRVVDAKPVKTAAEAVTTK